jgi:hypothetical protein
MGKGGLELSSAVEDDRNKLNIDLAAQVRLKIGIQGVGES